MNLYRQLLDLLPDDVLLIGNVTAHHADGTSTITLPNGSMMRVRGQTVAVGENAFFRDGVIEGEAPDLPVEQIEV